MFMFDISTEKKNKKYISIKSKCKHENLKI